LAKRSVEHHYCAPKRNEENDSEVDYIITRNTNDVEYNSNLAVEFLKVKNTLENDHARKHSLQIAVALKHLPQFVHFLVLPSCHYGLRVNIQHVCFDVDLQVLVEFIRENRVFQSPVDVLAKYLFTDDNYVHPIGYHYRCDGNNRDINEIPEFPKVFL
jgi:hypothetical protein